MAKQAVFTTGNVALNLAFRRLHKNVQEKVLVVAAKEAAKHIKKDFRARVPVDTGAMRDSLSVRVYKSNKKAGTGKFRLDKFGNTFETQTLVSRDVGARCIIDRKLFYKRVFARGRELGWDRERGERTFYPALVELGSSGGKGKRPLTKSLYNNERSIRQIYQRKLWAAIARASVGYKVK